MFRLLREISILKTIYFNLKFFSMKTAVKLSVFISKQTLFYSLKGRVTLSDTFIRTGQIRIGFGYVGIFDKYRNRTILEVDGELIFNGSANIGHGSKLVIKGELNLGDNFLITAESSIICMEKITFGRDNLLSWNILIMDSDFHKIYENDKLINADQSIEFGDHNWIGCGCTILKGTKVLSNCVIGANSLLNTRYNSTYSILAGNPARTIKNNITWKM